MFVLRSIIALLLVCVVSSVVAHPLRGVHRRHIRARSASPVLRARSSCKARPSTTVSSGSLVATATANTFVAESTSEATTTHAPTSTHTVTSSHSSSSSSTTHSSAAPATTTDSSSATTLTGLLAALLPVSPLQSWSTSPSASNLLPLDDATFNLTHLMTELPHPYVNAPDGQLSMEATYPQGSWNFDQEPLGGLSFYAYGPENVDLTTAKEVTFGYSVYFEDDFAFNIGGKLPGVYGGNSDSEAYSCSGGRRDDGCFSSRLMWRADGAGEMYTYLPPDYTANNNVCDVPPKSLCNPTYGASVGRGSFNFEAGKSNVVSMRVRLNDVGQENGELQLWSNGQSVINVGGLVLRDSDAGRIRGLQVQTFFGGSDSTYASPKTQSSYFRDFTVAITETL